MPTVIGRVAVKVLPDTTTFRRDTERELNKIEPKLNPVKVSTKIDMSGASREFLEQLRTINQRNRNTDSRKIRFHATISRDGMRDAVVSARRHLQQLADQNKIDFTVGNLNGNASVKARMDLDQNSLDDVEDQIERWRSRVSPIKVDVQANLDGAGLVGARLAIVTRPRTVRIVPVLDNVALSSVATSLAALSGARFLTTYFQDMGRALGDLDKHAIKIVGLGVGFASLASAALASTSNVLALGSSLASIAPAALALPGIFGGIAIGVGVMVAALKDFHTVFPGVKQAFTDMQDVISTNFWDKAKAPMQEMLDDILPRLSTGFAQVATQLGGFFAGVATGVRGVLSSKLDQMFTDLSASITIATQGTQAMVGIITTLGSVGAGYLPRLAAWFVKIANQFDAFLNKAAASGELQEWIDTGITALKDLGRALKGVGSLFASLSRAATIAGGSGLSIFADTIKGIADAAKSPAFQTGLVGAFTAAHEAISLITERSGPGLKTFFTSLSSVLGTILPTIGAALGTALGAIATALSNPAFTYGLIELFQGMAAAVTALTPAFAPLAAALGALGGILATFLTVVGPIFATLLGALSDALVQLAPTLEKVIPLLGAALLDAIQQIVPLLPSLVESFAAILTSLVPLLPALLPLVAQLLILAITALPALLPLLAIAVQVFSDLAGVLTTAVEWINQFSTAVQVVAIGALIAWGIQATVSAALVVVAWASSAAAAVAAAATTALRVYIMVAQFVILSASAAANAALVVLAWISIGAAAVRSAVIHVAQVAIQVLQWLALKVAAAANAALVAAAWVVTQVAAVAAALVTVAQVAIQVASWIAMKVAAVAQAALVAAAWVVTQVAAIAATTIMVAQRVIFVAAWIAMRVAAATSAAAIAIAWLVALGPIGLLIAAVLLAVVLIVKYWSQIRTAVETGAAAIVTVLKKLPGIIKSVFTGAGDFLLGAGRAIIDGLLKGIRAGFDKVKSALGELTGMLPSWKGPPKRDKTLLVDAGTLIIDGLIEGLESRYGAVKKSLGGLTSDIAGTAFDSPNMSLGSATGGLSGSINASLAPAGSGSSSSKTLIYNAAPGSSLGSEEDLWAASSRTRMVGW